MKFFKILTLNLIILSYSNAEGYEKTAQYDSLKIKISQMLIFGIQDAQKVLGKILFLRHMKICTLVE